MAGVTVKTYDNRIITIDTLAKAIIKSVDRQDLKPEAANKIATHVMNFFGYSDSIIDNILDPEDRDPFYMLEDLGLLMTEREESTLYDGREWRIHYWLLRKERINELNIEDDNSTEEASSVYDEIPEDLWKDR